MPALPVLPPAPPRSAERWSGAAVEPVSEALASSVTPPRVEGLYVHGVEARSPAERAGLRAGDVLLLVGGRYVDTPEALAAALNGAPLGSAVPAVARRRGDLVTVRLPVEESPGGRLIGIIRTPPAGLLHLASDGAVLWGYGPVGGAGDRGIVPIQLPTGPLPPIPPRPVASAIADRVIAADGEHVYLGWAGSELHVDVYELASGRVGRVPVRGAEGLANRCRLQGVTRVGGEVWLACLRPEGPALVRVELASGAARIEPLPPTYVAGLAFDGEAVLWLCCHSGGRVSLSRTDLRSGEARTFPLGERATSVAADRNAVYLLTPAGISYYKPWR
jgi:hypothetical protein